MDNFSKKTFADMEYKTYISPTLIGDIHVDVNIKFQPTYPYMHTDTKDEIAIDSVNMRLAMVSGEVKRVVEEQVRKMINDVTVSKD